MLYRSEKDVGSFEIRRGRNLRIMKGVLFLIFVLLLPLLVLTINTPMSSEGADCDCSFCHGDYHNNGWNGCNGCHNSPPQTGSHLVHYGNAAPQNLQYGDLSINSTADAYMFGCGNCHPLDPTKHRDGILQVELYNGSSPAGSIKAKNPSNAAYTAGQTVTSYTFTNPQFNISLHYSYSNGTCNNVYCHSGFTVVSSSDVSLPLTILNPLPPGYPTGYTLNWGYYIMDQTCSNVTYAPYTVTTGRSYKATPPWGTNSTGTNTTFTTCTECHEFPLTTYEPASQAGVGDSHQWVGWNSDYPPDVKINWRHAYNMGFDPVPCRTCHYGTVTQAGTTYWTTGSGGADIVAYNPVPLASRTMHVTGTPNVTFDTVNGFRYYWPGWFDQTYSLQSATYDQATKTCSDVACHYSQKKVKWGGPHRMDEGQSGEECDVCHRTGYLSETCTTP